MRQEIEDVGLEKEEIINEKEEEIRKLSLRIEAMSFEFADMLKETLDKMAQRIEIGHSTWDNGEGGKSLQARLNEFSLHEED